MVPWSQRVLSHTKKNILVLSEQDKSFDPVQKKSKPIQIEFTKYQSYLKKMLRQKIKPFSYKPYWILLIFGGNTGGV